MREVRVPPRCKRRDKTSRITPRSRLAAVLPGHRMGLLGAGLRTGLRPVQMPLERARSAWAEEIGGNLRDSAMDTR